MKWYRPQTNDNCIQLDNYILSQSTLQGCYKKEVYESIYKTEFEEFVPLRSIDEVLLPEKLEIRSINDALVDHGLRLQDADNISITLQRVIRLANWYVANDRGALEEELVTFLVIPFLIALGWSEQKIKLEYSNIDVAIFNKSFTGNYSQTPYIILEAKTFSNGLAFTTHQIKSYSEKFPDCKKFIATNGFRYNYFELEKGTISHKGGLNLSYLKDRDVISDCPLNTIETILAMSNF